jgi:hypothetical protein
MKPDYRNIEEIETIEDYEMIPLEPRMYGYDQMNMMPSMDFNQSYGRSMGYMQNVNPNMGMYPCTGMNPCMGMNPNMGMNRGMDTNPNEETSPSIGIHPNMEMDPGIETNSWMEMSQLNEDMFMNGFNPISMMYGDIPMKDTEEENETSRQKDNHGDTEGFEDGYNRHIKPNTPNMPNKPYKPNMPNMPNKPYKPNKPNMKHSDVDSIVRRIERYNPLIFRLLNRCGMPYAEAKVLVRRIVSLTLMYSEE